MNHTAHESSVSALLVGAYEKDRPLLREIFRNLRWRLFEARDRRRALHCLGRNAIHVVIAGTDVPDWNWKRVLHDLRGLEQTPQLIVTSRNADDYLWAEALNVGAYDVLAQPLDRSEVERVIQSARRHFEVKPEGAVKQGSVAPAA
ncbi:MAG: response regulator [Acidobacteriia bacterium]|nr:response regulator [Terriglobia bacterium]